MKAVFAFVLGLGVRCFKPSEEEEREFVSINNRLLLSQRYKSCVCFRAGFGFFRSFKPSEEEERVRSFRIFYRYHGRAASIFCQACNLALG
jgi:hypothetical protein